MDPKQNAAKSQGSKSGGATTSGRKRRKKAAGASSGGEETPITISGGSIVVEFNPDFDDDSSTGLAASGPKLKKVKSPPTFPDMRFTRVVVKDGRGGRILNEYPPAGLELSRGCIIEIKGQKK